MSSSRESRVALDTRYCDPDNCKEDHVLLAIVREPRSESNAFDESASRGLRAVCALSQPIGKAMSAISARGRVLVPGQSGGMDVVTLVCQAWGQRCRARRLRACVERVLPATLKRHGSSGRVRAYGIFLYKMVSGVSSLRLPSLARRQGRQRKHGLTTIDVQK